MKIKFLACADYHLHPQYPIFADGITKIVDRAKQNNVDAIIHLGDFIIDIKNQKAALDEFLHNDAGIPAFGCYGNHELELTDSLETLNKAYGIENSYYYRDVKGFRFVITDANFFEIDGEIKRYPGFSVGGPNWDYDHNLLSKEQLDWLKDTLMTSPYPCIILSHSTFFNIKSSSRDAENVRSIINEVNEKFPKRVLLCMNGHYHTDSMDVLDNVAYFNVNTVYMGGWRPEKHNCFPKEFAEKYESADNGVFFKDPLSAIVTVDSDGIIDVEGMETSYIYDVTPEKIEISIDDGDGLKVPYISNSHIELKGIK